MLKITLLFLLPIFVLWGQIPASLPISSLPDLANKSTPFRGKIFHSGYEGYTWVTYPHVENSAVLMSTLTEKFM